MKRAPALARRAVRLLLALSLGLIVSSAVAGCGSQTPAATTTDPAAQVVQRLLEQRLARSRDVSGYRLFFRADSTIPTSLAQAASQEASATKPPIPEWEPPYVSSSTTSTADIVVVWKKSDAFPEHAAATVFSLSRQQGRWVILNAGELGKGAAIPKPVTASP